MSVQNNQNQEIVRWKFYQSIPIKFELSKFNVKQNELLIEKIEFAFNRIERVKKNQN